jgi:hypothetical protein
LSPFSSAVINHAHFRELSFEKETWVPFGPFARAYDYFGDGSFFLLDTLGHMPGHMGAIACTLRECACSWTEIAVIIDLC